jgi:DNA invertase Pin-like site-specific DNA recombinase
MIPVVLYLRMSSAKQDTSIDDQRAELRKYAKRHGFRIVREYIDEAISGDETRLRLGFQRMIADAPKGEFKAILCWDQDRFGRFDPLEAGYWIQPLRAAGVFLQTIAQGKIEWNDFAGRLMYSVQQEAKHSYLRDLSRNVIRGQRSAILNGNLVISRPPIGYRYVAGKPIIDERGAQVVRQIFHDYLAGKSTREIARSLNHDGIETHSGRPWTGSTVLAILKRETYCGVFQWSRWSISKYTQVVGGELRQAPKRQRQKMPSDTIRVEDSHEPIIDRKTFDMVQSELLRRKVHTSPATQFRAFALSGLLLCGDCGHKMYGRRNHKGFAYYVCSQSIHSPGKCVTNAIPERDLLRGIIRKVLDVYGAPRYAESVVEALRGIHAGRRKQPVSASVSRQQLASLDAKIASAERRLVEVDVEFVPVVQDKIRKLRSEKESLTRTAAINSRSTASLVQDQQRFIDEAQRGLLALEERIDKVAPDVAHTKLQLIIENATVHTERIPRGSRFSFRLKSVEIRLKTQAHT